MKKVKIALVGRPNVGKSALFNRILKKRIAIVDEMEGVTRDRLYGDTEIFGRPFELIDTGGIDEKGELPFAEEVRRQAEIAIEEADGLIMVVDARVGITALDESVARILRKSQKPIFVAVNKVDDSAQESLVAPFYALGLQDVFAVSAVHGSNIAELLEGVLASCPEYEEEEEDDSKIKVAIVGRPNVGKSTLINTLLEEERCVVSPIAGTTRDSIDVSIAFGEGEFTFIDTAGIRRKKAEHEVVDKFAAIRTERAIQRADVCIFMLDATKGLTSQEKRIAQMIEEEGKGCILFFNKWDLVKGFRMEHCLQSLKIEASFLNYCPTIFGSARTGRNLEKLFSSIEKTHTNLSLRISTGQLNKFVQLTMQKVHPPMIQGRRLRVYYMAEVDVNPPRFVFFVNHSSLMSSAYKKYLINQFRENYPFEGAPIRFYLKGKSAEKKEKKSQEKVALLEAQVENLSFEE